MENAWAYSHIWWSWGTCQLQPCQPLVSPTTPNRRSTWNHTEPPSFTAVSFQATIKNFWSPDTQLQRLSSVRAGTPRPCSPVTRWVAFHWVLWTLQLDKHYTAHSACLAAVWTVRPRRDPLLHFICHPTATRATLPLPCSKIKNLVQKHDPWFLCTLSGRV